MYGKTILSNFNKYLVILDEKSGHLGINKIIEHIFQRLEIFCKFHDIKNEAINDHISMLSNQIKEMTHDVSLTMRSVFGESIPGFERNKEWGPMQITESIKNRLIQFKNMPKIIERTAMSFESFFKSFQTTKIYYDHSFEDCSYDSLIEIQIVNVQRTAFEQVNDTAKTLQNVETILSHGILLLKNEDDVLNVLLDYVDECTKILDKFATLHPLYKVLLGKNYLSNLKLILNNLMEMFKNSNLILMNSPKEFLSELKRKYPNLIYLLCESYLNETLRKNLEFLPDTIKKAIESANRNALSKLGDKLINHAEDIFLYDTDALFKYKQNVNLKENSKQKKYKIGQSKNDKKQAAIQKPQTKPSFKEEETKFEVEKTAEVKTSSNESLTDEASNLINPIDADANSAVSLKQYISKNKLQSPDVNIIEIKLGNLCITTENLGSLECSIEKNEEFIPPVNQIEHNIKSIATS